MYKLRNTTISGSESWMNATFYVDNQQLYESYLEVAAMVPSVLFMFLNVVIARRQVTFDTVDWLRLAVGGRVVTDVTVHYVLRLLIGSTLYL